MAAGDPRRVAAVDPAPVRAALGGHGLEVIRFDFTEAASWPAALARVERMFLLRPRSCRGFAATCTRPWTRPPRPGRARELSSIQGPSATGWCPTGPSRTSCALADDLAFVRAAYFLQNLSTTTPPSSASATSSGSGRHGRTAFVDARDLAARPGTSGAWPATTLPPGRQPPWLLPERLVSSTRPIGKEAACGRC